MNRRDFLKAAGVGLVTAERRSWAGVPAASSLLVEGESFKERGGWVLDQQAMDRMGAPYLMAHGLGVSVANAKRSITVVTPVHRRQAGIAPASGRCDPQRERHCQAGRGVILLS